MTIKHRPKEPVFRKLLTRRLMDVRRKYPAGSFGRRTHQSFIDSYAMGMTLAEIFYTKGQSVK